MNPASSSAAARESSSSDDDENHFTVSQVIFDNLVQRGFSENAIKNAIAAGCVDENTCTQWITMHEGHPDLDKPLADGVVVTVKAKRVLTEAERAEKVRELQLKIKAKKEADEEEARQKELARIEMGRKAALVKSELDAVRRQKEVEEAQREKAEDALAKKRLKIQLLADKYERQGMSDEQALAQAKKEIEEASQKAADEAALRLRQLQESQGPRRSGGAASTAGGGATSGQQWNLNALLDAAPDAMDSVQKVYDEPEEDTDSAMEGAATLIHACEDAEKHKACVDTLRLILTNICDHPFDAGKRTLKTTTKTFTQRILPVDGAVKFLRSCNFDLATDAEGGQVLMMSTVVLRPLRHAMELLS